MARLHYAFLGSLDGFAADERGEFGWAAPDAEVHGFVNALEREIGTLLYGRRMYETMVFWETAPTDGEPAEFREYAELWRAADKVVFSRTLDTPRSARTRLERDFDPAALGVLKRDAQRDLSIGGAELAGQALAAGLVDEVHVFVAPVVVGAGTSAWPQGLRASLTLREQRSFASGFAYLRYDVGGAERQPASASRVRFGSALTTRS